MFDEPVLEKTLNMSKSIKFYYFILFTEEKQVSILDDLGAETTNELKQLLENGVLFSSKSWSNLQK